MGSLRNLLGNKGSGKGFGEISSFFWGGGVGGGWSIVYSKVHEMAFLYAQAVLKKKNIVNNVNVFFKILRVEKTL